MFKGKKQNRERSPFDQTPPSRIRIVSWLLLPFHLVAVAWGRFASWMLSRDQRDLGATGHPTSLPGRFLSWLLLPLDLVDVARDRFASWMQSRDQRDLGATGHPTTLPGRFLSWMLLPLHLVDVAWGRFASWMLSRDQRDLGATGHPTTLLGRILSWLLLPLHLVDVAWGRFASWMLSRDQRDLGAPGTLQVFIHWLFGKDRPRLVSWLVLLTVPICVTVSVLQIVEVRRSAERIRRRAAHLEEDYRPWFATLLEIDPDSLSLAQGNVAGQVQVEEAGAVLVATAEDTTQWQMLIQAYTEAGQLDHAIHAFREASSLTPDNVEIRLWLACIYLSAHEFAEAIAAAEKAVALDSKDARTHFCLAVCHYRSNDRQSAIHSLKKAFAAEKEIPASIKNSKLLARMTKQLNVRDVTTHPPN